MQASVHVTNLVLPWTWSSLARMLPLSAGKKENSNQTQLTASTYKSDLECKFSQKVLSPKTPRTALRGRCKTSMRGLQPETPLSLTTLFHPIYLPLTDSAKLDKWLSMFAVETINGQGKCYTPSTTYQILSGFLRSMREINPDRLPKHH